MLQIQFLHFEIVDLRLSQSALHKNSEPKLHLLTDLKDKITYF